MPEATNVVETVEKKDGRLTRRFVAGILIGFLASVLVVAILVLSLTYVFKGSMAPILGMGGISTWQDAVQYIAAGSDVVQICTEVMLNGFKIIDELKKGLLNYLENKKIDNILKLKNVAVTKITSHEQLNKNYKLFPEIDATKCVKCGKCIELCLENEGNALSKDNAGNVVLNKENCLNCSLCKLVCPKQAITMCI